MRMEGTVFDLMRDRLNLFRAFADKLVFISDDKAYIRCFESSIGPDIYKKHLDEYFVCCAFCRHLQKSICHDNCFTCRLKSYHECSALLPGVFSFMENHFSAAENNIAPWIFRTPCTRFERLDRKQYYKNFSCFSQTVTVSYYEALEGIFTGMTRGKSPCHICASVNMGIYNGCRQEEKNAENKRCSKITEQIALRYRGLVGMVKYVE